MCHTMLSEQQLKHYKNEVYADQSDSIKVKYRYNIKLD